MAGRILITHIVQAAEACTGVTLEQLRSESKKQPLIFIRHACIILAHKYTDHTKSRIGDFFQRNHSTVHYVLGTAGTMPKEHPGTSNYVRLIEDKMLQWAQDGYLTAWPRCTRRAPVLLPPPMQSSAEAV